MAKIKVTLIKSTIGVIPKHKKTIEALGLRKINSNNIHEDNAAIRGMTRQVSHLIKVEEVVE
ncbi:MAG: 50S ribosomal protein L30 [Epulopiscium sp. Nuni2H_MBin003]|nr:MAG: 50S ribosomal protein L30 [Epulopiscium sp. Nuni2H_MBin003]